MLEQLSLASRCRNFIDHKRFIEESVARVEEAEASCEAFLSRPFQSWRDASVTMSIAGSRQAVVRQVGWRDEWDLLDEGLQSGGIRHCTRTPSPMRWRRPSRCASGDGSGRMLREGPSRPVWRLDASPARADQLWQ
eukprot:12112124-Alexandrium_andersonii.AAC.1